MSNWRTRPIRDLCSSIIDCVNKTAPVVEEPTPWKMIRTTNVKNGRVDLVNVRYVDEQIYRRWVRRGEPRDGDIVLTREAPLGEVGMLRDPAGVFLGQRLVMYRADPAQADQDFLLYAMRGPSVQSQIKAYGSGSTVEHMRVPDCGELLVQCPDVRAQRRIGVVLAAFDSLIEINERRIELLEELARSLYREWFVRFRFPGHEHTALASSSMDPVPRGWELTSLGSMAKWLSGGTPSTKAEAFWGGGIPWITSGTLTTLLLNQSPRTLTAEGVAAGSRLVERDTLLFVVRGMSLVREFRVGIADRTLAFGQDCKALVATEGVDPLFLAFSVLERQHDIQGMVELAGHGTGKLATDRLKAIALPLPPTPIQTLFTKAVRPIRELMSVVQASSKQLAATRDLLLPRLVTRRLDIADVDLGDLLPSEAA